MSRGDIHETFSDSYSDPSDYASVPPETDSDQDNEGFLSMFLRGELYDGRRLFEKEDIESSQPQPVEAPPLRPAPLRPRPEKHNPHPNGTQLGGYLPPYGEEEEDEALRAATVNIMPEYDDQTSVLENRFYDESAEKEIAPSPFGDLTTRRSLPIPLAHRLDDGYDFEIGESEEGEDEGTDTPPTPYSFTHRTILEDGIETESGATPEDIIEIAIPIFAEQGYKDTRLKTIASVAGISKRMIHYHFEDKEGLYIQVIRKAIKDLRPEIADLDVSNPIPIEGIRSMVEAIHKQVCEHPDAARLLIMESQQDNISMTTAPPYADQSQALLCMERLLMLGQDSGAFRPGISVMDIYTLIISISLMPLTYHSAYSNLYNVNLKSEANKAGLKQLAIDTVLAFLTSNIRPHGGVSYLHTDAIAQVDPSADTPDQINDLYFLEDTLYED